MAHVQLIRGFDLFNLLPNEAPWIIVHGVNDAGAWGRGFTAQLDQHLPWARGHYRKWAAHGGDWPDPPGPLRLGGCFVGHAPNDPSRAVAHLCVQHGLRSRQTPAPFRRDALGPALARLTLDLPRYPGAVWMPAIGTGLGGYPFLEDILQEIERWNATVQRAVFVCTDPPSRAW